MVSLGAKLKNFRKLNNKTQLDLETDLNYPSGYVSRIESGNITPFTSRVREIADYLDLNDLQINYLIGKIAQPPTKKEIDKAKSVIREYFDKKTTIAYLLDDRSRLIDISKGCLLALGIKDKSKIIGEVTPRLILDPKLGINQVLRGNNYEETVKNAFLHTFDEMHFMKGDQYYKKVMKWVNATELTKTLWKELEMGKHNLRTNENRTATFKVFGQEIKLSYTNEHLPKQTRFRLLDYKPTNFLLRTLSQLF
jgi:transcriptional regulator with XRE-family HTH domain